MTYSEAAGLIDLCRLHNLPPPALRRQSDIFLVHWETPSLRFAAQDYEAASLFCQALWQERQAGSQPERQDQIWGNHSTAG